MNSSSLVIEQGKIKQTNKQKYMSIQGLSFKTEL